MLDLVEQIWIRAEDVAGLANESLPVKLPEEKRCGTKLGFSERSRSGGNQFCAAQFVPHSDAEQVGW